MFPDSFVETFLDWKTTLPSLLHSSRRPNVWLSSHVWMPRSMRGFRPSILESQEPGLPPPRPFQCTTDVAPITKSLLTSRWPIFEVRPRFCLPPLECCRAKAKPGCKIATTSKCLHRRREASDCHRANRPDPWHFLEPSNDIALFCFRCDTTIDLIKFFVRLSDLAEIKASHDPYQLGQIVRRIERREPLNVA